MAKRTDEEKFNDGIDNLSDAIREAEFRGDEAALEHLRCAETTECLADLIANLNAAFSATKKGSVRKEIKALLAEVQ